MLFRNTLYLSILFTSVSAVTLGPLLVARQNTQCQNECSSVLNQIQGGTCDAACICTPTMISAISSCVQCAEGAGITIPGVGPNYIQTLETDCANAGYPVSGVSSNSGSSTTGGLSGTGLGNGGSTTATATLGNIGGTTSAAGSHATSTSSGGSGITFGKSSATGLTAQLSAVAAAVFGVVVLAA